MNTKISYMTYRKIFDLKYKRKVPTLKLHQDFPQDQEKISEIALLELSEKTLSRLVRDEKKLERVLNLKKKYKTKNYS